MAFAEVAPQKNTKFFLGGNLDQCDHCNTVRFTKEKRNCYTTHITSNYEIYVP
jgi:hypothetical protein